MRLLHRFLLALLLLPALASPVLAQDVFLPGRNVLETNPQPTKDMCWTGTAYALCGTNGASKPVNQVDGTPVTFTPALAAGSILFTADTTGFRGVGFQLVPASASGAVVFEASDDNINWRSQFVQSSDTGVFVTTVATSNMVGTYYAPATHRYFRVRVSSASSGNINGTAYLRQANLDAASTAVSLQVGTPGAVAAMIYADTTASALAASASTTATGRDAYNTAGTAGAYPAFPMFRCMARADAAGGTLTMLSGATTALAGAVLVTQSVPAGSTVVLSSPVFYRYQGCRFDNGANAQTALYVAGQYGM